MGLRSLSEFGKYLETDRPKNQDRFSLSGCEYLSISTALLAKDLYSTVGKTYQVNESDVFDIQPLRVAPADRNSAVIPGMFSGFTLQENSSNGAIIRRKVCIKTEITSHERDLVTEVKMFEESSSSLVAGVVEYLASGMASTGPYLITEHFGMNLSQYLTVHVPSMMDRINLFTEICVCVCSLHAVGLMHGAITPEHILIADTNTSSRNSTFLGAASGVDGMTLTTCSQVKLCNLLCCRRIGDSFPINAANELKIYSGGYVAPEVYFGRVGVCRATTKIDAFTLSLIGYHLLNRRPSGMKHLFPAVGEGAGEEMKRYLKDQERINEMILTDLDSPLSDIITSVCQLNPGDRCDIETVVNMLQIRNSDIQSDLTSLMSLGDMYDELFAKLLSNLLGIKQFLVFDSGGYSLFLSLVMSLRTLTGNIAATVTESEMMSDTSATPASSTATPTPAAGASDPTAPPSLSLKDFHQHLTTFLGYLRKRGYTDNPLSPRLSLEEPQEFPEEILLNKIISIVEENHFTGGTSAIKEKISSLATQMSPLETEITAQRTVVCLFGDAIGRCLSESIPRSLSKCYKVLESRDLWMDDVTRDQCDELQSSILKMNASLLAVKNINRGLVRFMSNELSNLQKTYFDLVKRCYSVPIYCLLLPCLHSATTTASSAGPSSSSSRSPGNSLSLRLKKHKFRLQFLCSHTHQLLPTNIFDNESEIIVTLDRLSRECIAPVALTCLTLLRAALKGNPKLQQTLIPGLLPAEMTDPDPSHQLPFLDCAYHLLHPDSIYSSLLLAEDGAPQQDPTPSCDFVDLGLLCEVPPIESVAAYPPLVLTTDIAKFSYQKLTSLIKTQNPSVDLAASGLRLVTSEKKKFGWIIDSDDIETRYLRSS
jgi:serine/threonine protein kinase